MAVEIPEVINKKCTYTANHARSGAADLQVVLADLGSVEHRVERGDFVDLHRCHFEHLGHLVHRGECKEVIVLFLRDKQHWDHAARFVVVWVPLKKGLNCSV